MGCCVSKKSILRDVHAIGRAAVHRPQLAGRVGQHGWGFLIHPENHLPTGGVGPQAAATESGLDEACTAAARFPVCWLGAWRLVVPLLGKDRIGTVQMVSLFGPDHGAGHGATGPLPVEQSLRAGHSRLVGPRDPTALRHPPVESGNNPKSPGRPTPAH